jgi:twitching motility protein PilT
MAFVNTTPLNSNSGGQKVSSLKKPDQPVNNTQDPMPGNLNIKVEDSGVKEFRHSTQDPTQGLTIKPMDFQEKDSSNLPAEVVKTTSSALNYKNYSFEELLQESLRVGASDLHFNPGSRAIARINGNLESINSQVFTNELIIEYTKKLTQSRNDIDIATLTEVDLTYTFKNRRFRFNIYKQSGKYTIVCRIIPEKILTIEELQLPIILKEFIKFPSGLVIVAGPTGNGKSTTIASILNLINVTQSKHIVTLEDPIEYVFPPGLSLISQREWGVDFKSWGGALRSVLRQDPNIVLVGEMRDLESVEAALQVAETGHLVFATLHTNSASQTIDRIIDIFPANKQEQIRIQVASVIRAVVSQRLVGVVHGGRRAAVEIMIANSAIKNAIRDKKSFLIDNIIQTSNEVGMISIEKSLVTLIREGLISEEAAKLVSLKPSELKILLER